MSETQIEQVYLNLGKRIGWFENSKVTPRIFKLLLNFEQAQLADLFPALPEELAEKTGTRSHRAAVCAHRVWDWVQVHR